MPRTYTDRLDLAVSPQLRAALEVAAAKADLTLSQLVRAVLASRLGLDPVEEGPLGDELELGPPESS